MLYMFDPKVNIGFNKDMDPAKSHGLARVRSIEGGDVIDMPFLVDNPQHLAKPSLFVTSALFNQIAKMGFYPLTLEITVCGQRVVYQHGRLLPLLRQRLH